MTLRRFAAAATAVVGLAAAVPAQAQETTTTFESCIDAAGHTLPAVADATLPMLVETRHVPEGVVIRYNPSLLPRLKPMTRLFFFAHECARNALGDREEPEMSVERSQRADCLGLATMLEGGQLKREEIPELQADLTFSEDEWSVLPGLPRHIDLSACHSTGVVKLPLTATPSAQRSAWTSCVRACADPLLKCGSGCQDTYNRCVAGCGSKDNK